MYINGTQTYYTSDGTQHARRADFLILMQSKDNLFGEYPSVRAIVRKVALEQFGHWMMGEAKIKNHSITISGTYGSDGLIKTVPDEVYKEGIQLPEYLYLAWAHGNGWNSAGTEASQMREWANNNIHLLVSKSDPRSRRGNVSK